MGAVAGMDSPTPAYVTVNSGELVTIKLSALDAQSNQLAAVLADIPALGVLPTGTLNTILQALPGNSTLQDLLNAIKTATGVEVTAAKSPRCFSTTPPPTRREWCLRPTRSRLRSNTTPSGTSVISVYSAAVMALLRLLASAQTARSLTTSVAGTMG